MFSERIWAPWRLAYVKAAAKNETCVFCDAPAAGKDEEKLIVHRAERSFVILNLFPDPNGHRMVSPFEHLARLQDLDAATLAEMMALAQRAMSSLDDAYGPEGFNVGFNQGRVAGAGVDGHIHLHVVPRWAGDTNYMPVLADTRVMPQTLEESYATIREGFEK